MSNTQNDAALLEAARRIIAAHQTVQRPEGLPREHHGPLDPTYVRPPATEFPKVSYKASDKDPRGYITKTVNSKAEEDKLAKGWSRTLAEMNAILDPIAKRQYASEEELVTQEK